MTVQTYGYRPCDRDVEVEGVHEQREVDGRSDELAHDHPVDPDRVARARAAGIAVEEAQQLAGVLSLMADPVRARILYALDLVDELCVGDLALALGATEDAVGYGLRMLRTAGLVTSRKQGRIVFYRLAPDFPQPLLDHCLRQLVALTRKDTCGGSGGTASSRRSSVDSGEERS